MNKIINLGVIGFNEKNGHPYSFSAIINGYNKFFFKKIGYKNIYRYLEKRNKKDFGIAKVKITHCWSQNYSKTLSLSKACLIENPVRDINQMINEVDAVIIARDDWKSHYPLAIKFLRKRKPVFIDKPLSLSIQQLKIFQKYIKKGLLFSSSALRFSNEVLSLRKFLKTSGQIKLIIANVPGNIEKYGVHILEFLSVLDLLKPLEIKRITNNYKSYSVKLKKNIFFLINCLENKSFTVNVTFVCKKKYLHINFTDNFVFFKNTLKAFIQMIYKKKEIIPYKQTLNIMNLIRNIKRK